MMSVTEFRVFDLIQHFAKSGSNEDRKNLEQLVKTFFPTLPATSAAGRELSDLIFTKDRYDPDKIYQIALREIQNLNMSRHFRLIQEA